MNYTIKMTHPLIPEITKLASPIANELGLEIIEIIFQTNKNPPVLRINIQNSKEDEDISLDNCEQMSRILEETLDSQNIIPGNYLLEISSPGISEELSTDRDFISFKGFPVVVKSKALYKNKQEWRGNLQGRDEQTVYLNQKGKIIKIPRELVSQVKFDEQI